MNNSMKRLLSNKKLIIIGSSIVLLTIGALAFFPNGEKANGLFSEGTISEVEDSKLTLFSSYDIIGESTIKLFKDDKSNFVFVDDTNTALYKTKDNVEYFKILNKDTLVYLTTVLNTSTNKYVSDVKVVDIKAKTEKILHTGEQLSLGVANEIIYIVDNLKGDVLYGDDIKLSKLSLKNKAHKLVINKGKVFVVNHSVINDTIRSIVYLIDNGKAEEVIRTEGKVQSVTVDFNNDNLLYYSTDVLNSNGKGFTTHVKSKYIINLSPTESGEKSYPGLNSTVYSLKDRYLTIDSETREIILLNNNLTKSKVIGTLHENTLNSLIKESDSGEYLYFINSSGTLTRA